MGRERRGNWRRGPERERGELEDQSFIRLRHQCIVVGMFTTGELGDMCAGCLIQYASLVGIVCPRAPPSPYPPGLLCRRHS